MRKLKNTEGCTAWGFDLIDDNYPHGTDVDDLSEDTLHFLTEKVVKKFLHGNPERMKSFLQWATDEFGEYDREEEPCEQCGDWVSWHTLDLEEE